MGLEEYLRETSDEALEVVKKKLKKTGYIFEDDVLEIIRVLQLFGRACSQGRICRRAPYGLSQPHNDYS